jgi:hypothetical protein
MLQTYWQQERKYLQEYSPGYMSRRARVIGRLSDVECIAPRVLFQGDICQQQFRLASGAEKQVERSGKRVWHKNHMIGEREFYKKHLTLILGISKFFPFASSIPTNSGNRNL